MEPININANNSELQEVTDDQLEKVVQDFNEFRERMAQSSSSGDMELEDVINLYINSGGENSYSTPQTTWGQVTALLEDFNKFESMLLPHQVQSAHVQSTHGFNIDREIQETEMMIQEMTEDTCPNDTESFPDSSQTNINSHVGVVSSSSSSKVTHIRYGDLNCHETAGGIIGSVFGGSSETVFGSVMRFFRTPGAGGMNYWPHVGMKENADRTTRRRRVKRKYRGVIETEEETADRMERTKIKNREAAAKAHANKQAHEAYIRSQLSKLRRKNEFLRKLVTFLEGHKRINLCPEPLRRTISGPQGISMMDIYILSFFKKEY